MATSSKRWLLAAAAAVLLLLLTTYASQQSVPEVLAAPVMRDAFSIWIVTNGMVEPIVPYSVRARFPTFVERVFATEG